MTIIPVQVRQRLSRVALAIVLVSAARSGQAAAPLDQARADWEAGKTRAAVVAIKGLLQQDSQDAAARTLLIRVYLGAGQVQAAVETIDQARALGVPRPAWVVELAEAELLRGRLTEVLAIDAADADTPGRRADLLALHGEALLRLERADEAAQALAQALEADPDNSRARLVQALLARQQQDPARARELITATLDLEPTSSTAWSRLGELELLEGHAAAARDAFSHALDHAPAKGMPHYQRALALIDLNELEAARADLEAAAPDLGGFPGLDLAWGRLLLQQGQPEAALARLETLLKVMPGHPPGLLLAAACQVQLKQPQQAEERLSRFLKTAPGDWRATALLAEARLQRGDAQGAESILAPLAAGANPAPAILKVLAQALTTLGRQEDARQVLAQLVQAEPGAAEPRLALARSQLGAGEADEAIAGLQGLLGQDPDNLAARGLLAFGYLRGGDPAGALSTAEALWDRAPDEPRSLELLGLALVGQDDEAGARLVFNQALTLKPGLPVAALALATLEQRAGRGQAARELLERTLGCAPGETRLILALAGLDLSEDRRPAALQRLTQAVAQHPDDRTLRRALARLQLAGGNPAQALQTLGPVIPNQAPVPVDLLLRAQAQVAARQPADAIATLEALVKERPDTAIAHYHLAFLYASQGAVAAMTDHLTQGVQLDSKSPAAGPAIGAVLGATPDPAARRRLLETLLVSAAEQPRVLAELGQLSLAEHQTARALTLFGTLRRVAPQAPAGALGLMNALAQAERFAEAAAVGEAWLTQPAPAADPQDAPDPAQPGAQAAAPTRRQTADAGVAGGLAEVYLKLNRPADAARLYEQVIAVRPDDWAALNNRAYLIKDKDPAAALPLAERAVHLRPADADVADTLNGVLVALAAKDPGQALATARRYQGERPTDPLAAITLSRLLTQAGQGAEALSILSSAYAVGPTHPGLALRYAEALAADGDTDRARTLLRGLTGKTFPEQGEARALLERLKE